MKIKCCNTKIKYSQSLNIVKNVVIDTEKTLLNKPRAIILSEGVPFRLRVYNSLNVADPSLFRFKSDLSRNTKRLPNILTCSSSVTTLYTFINI